MKIGKIESGSFPSVELKIAKMRKMEEFVTYPVWDVNGEKILPLQSDHFWAELNLDNGDIEVSARRAQYANQAWMTMCRIKGTTDKDIATMDQVDEIVNGLGIRK